jgi:iron(III) transport system permease protein
MDDAGDSAQAAAMSVLIIAVGLAVRFGYWALMRGVNRRAQAWLVSGVSERV